MPGTLSNGAGNKAGNSTGAPSSLEADIALLSSLLSQDNVDESDPDVAELLRRLEAAEGIAEGVENRLDGIIDHLDNLLGDLETQTVPKRAEGGATAVAQVEEEVVIVTTTQEGTPEGQEK